MTRDNKETILFKCRDWLNKNEGVAMVDAQVRTYESSRGFPCIDGSITLGDCSRQIHLEFDLDVYMSGSSKAEVRKDVRLLKEKLKRMRKYVGGFIDAMDQAVEESETKINDLKLEKRKKA